MGEYMYIRSKIGDDLVMDVSGACTTPGTKIQSYTLNGTDAQQWKKELVGEDRFYLVSKLSTDAHSVKLEIKDDGHAVTSSFGTLLYELQPKPDIILIIDDNTGLALGVGSNPAAGTPIVANSKPVGPNGQPSQQWEFYRVE